MGSRASHARPHQSLLAFRKRKQPAASAAISSSGTAASTTGGSPRCLLQTCARPTAAAAAPLPLPLPAARTIILTLRRFVHPGRSTALMLALGSPTKQSREDHPHPSASTSTSTSERRAACRACRASLAGTRQRRRPVANVQMQKCDAFSKFRQVKTSKQCNEVETKFILQFSPAEGALRAWGCLVSRPLAWLSRTHGALVVLSHSFSGNRQSTAARIVFSISVGELYQWEHCPPS
jgi:hypothetical protein